MTARANLAVGVLFLTAIFSLLSVTFAASVVVVPSRGHADAPVAPQATGNAPVFDPETSPVKRVIAHTTDAKDLKFFESKGCRVVHIIDPVTALNCPAQVASEFNLEDDLVVFATDLNADVQIGADKVWASGFTGLGRLIAVLDTGIDYTHVELSDSIVNGKDFFNNDNDSMDDNGHGTHVAGIVTANGVSANAKGAAPDSNVLAVKVLSASGSGFLSDTVAAIHYVVNGPDGVYGTADDFNADAISMSLGTSPPYTFKVSNSDTVYPAMTNAIAYARSRNVSVVAAAGNSGGSGISLPGCISGVVTVGAVDSLDKVARWSGKGNSLDVVAPGVSILSTWLSGGYLTASGTSMATPHVSATVALMKQKNPALTPNQVTTKLTSTAKDLGKAGFDTSAGYGRVNATAAVNVS